MKRVLLAALAVLTVVFTTGYFVPGQQGFEASQAGLLLGRKLLGIGIALDLISICLLAWSEWDRIKSDPDRFPSALSLAGLCYFGTYFVSGNPVFQIPGDIGDYLSRNIVLLACLVLHVSLHLGILRIARCFEKQW
jgi:hypothetical protein